MPRRWTRSLGAAALCVAALAGCSTQNAASAQGSDNQRYVAGNGEVQAVAPADRKPAPVLTGRTLAGKKLTTASYKGKVLVVNFWASWCAPCRSEALALRAVAKHTKSDGVRFVGVNFKDNKTNASVFVHHFRIGYPSIYDQPGRTALQFRGQLPPAAVPSTIVIDRKGRVAARIIGETTYSTLNSLVRRVAR